MNCLFLSSNEAHALIYLLFHMNKTGHESILHSSCVSYPWIRSQVERKKKPILKRMAPQSGSIEEPLKKSPIFQLVVPMSYTKLKLIKSLPQTHTLRSPLLILLQNSKIHIEFACDLCDHRFPSYQDWLFHVKILHFLKNRKNCNCGRFFHESISLPLTLPQKAL